MEGLNNRISKMDKTRKNQYRTEIWMTKTTARTKKERTVSIDKQWDNDLTGTTGISEGKERR